MCDDMTQRDYYEQCRAIAEECVKEAEGDEERAQDLVHESVDGHQYIIYTHYNMCVLRHSRNDSAYFDNFGPLQADGFSDAMAKMAFAAMYQDVCEELGDALEAYNEAHAMVPCDACQGYGGNCNVCEGAGEITQERADIRASQAELCEAERKRLEGEES